MGCDIGRPNSVKMKFLKSITGYPVLDKERRIGNF